MKLTIASLLTAYICCFTLNSNAQSPTQNITFRSKLSVNQACANIWGYTQNGKEYALLGTFTGSSIIDVTNPDVPVLLKNIPALSSQWREIKTYKNYAYVTTEAPGQGLQIVNLAGLPDTSKVVYKDYKGGDSTLIEIVKIHALHVDTAKGFVYLYGGQSRVNINGTVENVDGAVVLDIKTDPWNPKFVGIFRSAGNRNNYIHDGQAENDTLYGSHIYGGYFSIVDFKDKKNPKVLGTQLTPSTFTHNTWLSDNHKTLFTTDERGASYLASYDISDPKNIRYLDKIRSVSGVNAIVHNTYIKNDYAVTSWYTEGVTIVDAHSPYNLVQVGQYDTYNGARASFNGAWGVYPYLPSGNLIVSNIEDGLYVLSPQYIRACYLEGRTIDSITREPLGGVRVKINSTDPDKNAESNLGGYYYTGQVTAGQVTATYSKAGYFDKTVTVTLIRGEVYFQNVELTPRGFAQSGSVLNNATGQKAGKSKIILSNATNTYTLDTEANGDFYVYNVQPGTYTATVGTWGYLHKVIPNVVVDGIKNHVFRLDKGYQDDFWADFAWEVSGTAANTAQGRWERGVPLQSTFSNTPVSTNADLTTDIGNQCFITGNAAGDSENSDVDTETRLTTPVINLTSYTNPILTFSYWFMNVGGIVPLNDKMKVYISNGVKDSLIFTISEAQTAWRGASISLKNIIPFTETMRIYFVVADDAPAQIVEAAIDGFKIQEASSVQDIATNWAIKAYPNPFNASLNIDFQLDKQILNSELKVYNMLGQVLEQKRLKNTEGVVSIGDNLAAGIYFVRIETNDKVSPMIRVVKQ
jgi:choice-of-anchor B domain-containing protein